MTAVTKWMPVAAGLVLIAILAVLGLPGSGFAAPNGKEIMESRCGSCHGLERVAKASKDRAGWQSTITRMISNGATLNAEEKEALIDYLVNK